MGNQCPQCETPIGDCKMRDVFKQQAKNRDDLDLSHIKKGDYKKKLTIKEIDNQSLSLGLNFGESVIIDKPQKKTKKSPPKVKQEMNISISEQIKKPLSMDGGIQTLQIKKGVKYSGGTVQRQPHERGKVTWQDGTILNGQFFLGQLAENEKIYMTLADGSTYDGQVVQGMANGKGKLTHPNGTFVEGQWKNDEPHGYCKQKMAGNAFYEGNFKNGVKSGKGKFYFDDGMYEGNFQNDQFHGEGIMILNDGRSIRGTWKKGVLQGKGEIQWQTGQKYSGNFSKNHRQGEGTYYYNDGRQWAGEWQDDLQHGFGSYQVRGEMIKSVWRSGIKKDQIREVDLHRA